MTRGILKSRADNLANFTLAQTTVLLCTLALCLQLALIAMLFFIRDSSPMVSSAGQARAISIAVRNMTTKSIASTLLALYPASSNATYDQSCQIYLKRIDQLREHLKGLWSASADKCKLVDTVADETISAVTMRYNWAKVAMLRHPREEVSQSDRRLPLNVKDELSKTEEHLEQSLFALCAPENLPFVSYSEREGIASNALFATALIGSLLNLLIFLTVAYFVNRNMINRVISLNFDVHKLGRGQRLASRAIGNDEVSKLDLAFREMAASMTEASHKQQTLFENAHDLLCYIEVASFRFTSLNKAVDEMLGYTPEQLIGEPCDVIFVDDKRTQAMQTFQQLVDSRAQPPFEMCTCNGEPFETRLQRADGGIADALVCARYMPSEGRLFCVVSDITERKAAERMRNEILQMVNHDLRSPLFAIRIIYSILETGLVGQLTEKGKNSLAMASSSTDLMLRLINDLLDIEKYESGMLELEYSHADLESIVEQAFQSVEMLAQPKKISLVNACCDLSVYADEHRLVQVLINLISNAIKFSPQDGTITVTAQALPGAVEISVIDNGRGIPKEQLKSVFERFKQVEASDASTRGGSGLGLTICKALIELHSGLIAAESEEGSGSRFYFQIPQ